MKILFQDRITLYFMQHRPCFGLLFVKTGKFSRNYGKYLANLKDDRESGDYEIFSYIDLNVAQAGIFMPL